MHSDDFLYIRGSGDVRSDLLSAIENQGYAPCVLSSVDEALNIARISAPKIVIVDASGGSAESSQRLIELSSANELHSVPVMFIAVHAKHRSNITAKPFSSFIAIDVPYQIASVLQQLAEVYPPAKSAAAAVVAPPEQIPAPPETAEVPAEEHKSKTDSDRRRIMLSRRLGASAYSHTLSELNPFTLNGTFGGPVLADAKDPSYFNDQHLISGQKNPEPILEALKEISKHDRWLGVHSRRVAFLSGALGSALGLRNESNLLLPGLLLGWGFSVSRQSAPTFDIFLAETDTMLDILYDVYLRSSELVRTKIEDRESANIIAAIAELLRSRNLDSAEEAECILLSELADHACWAQGRFDAYGAHRCIRKLAQQSPLKCSGPLLRGLGRILVEATNLASTGDPPPPNENELTSRERAALAEAVNEGKEARASAAHHVVEFENLEPGMVLAGPLVTRDGKVLLRTRTTLNEQLIFRLWQLATIRSIQASVEVFS